VSRWWRALEKRLGPDGDIMLDCWMSWTERYTLEMAELVAPHRVYWMEECLQPHDYEGFGRLNEAIKSTRIVTGEHEYTRYGFRKLLDHNCPSVWQPDIRRLWRADGVAANRGAGRGIRHSGNSTYGRHLPLHSFHHDYAERTLG
jgi:L-alanine-DL-glutamate epimerase-like enolase superfamily enzyme